MEFTELIKERRSVRAYREAEITHEELLGIMKEAQMAPSWKNMQASRCYIVESPGKVSAFRKGALPEYNQNSTAKASAYIVTTFVRNTVGYLDGKPQTELGNKWGAYDLGLHDAYLLLAARNAGWDTLVMGLRNVEYIRETLGIPAEEDVVSVIAVGKRSAEPVLRPRKETEEVAKFF